MVVYFRPSEDFGLGIIVSRKVDKRSVMRNQLKRRCREIVRLNRPERGQFIVVLRQRALSMEYGELKQDIERILAKTVQHENANPSSHCALPETDPAST